MIRVFGIEEVFPPEREFWMRRDHRMNKNYWGLELVSHANFEEAEHLLCAECEEDDVYGSSDMCPDLCEADTGIWTLPEKAWDWIPALQASGCRIAHNVKVERGSKQYKLIYAAPVLDLLDHDRSKLTWNEDTISIVHHWHLYDWAGELPLMFQVIFHNRSEYRGSMFGLSGKCVVSEAFVAECERRGLTGVTFTEIPRTQRPADKSAPEQVYLNSPK